MTKLYNLPSWTEICKSARAEAGLDISGFDNSKINKVDERHWAGQLGQTYYLQGVPSHADWEWKSHESKKMLDVVANALAPHGYAITRVVADFNAGSQNQKHRILIREFLPGMSMDARYTSLSPQKRVHMYREMGKLLGLIHTEVPSSAAPAQHHGWNIPSTPAVAYAKAGRTANILNWGMAKTTAYCAVLEQIATDRKAELAQGMGQKIFVHGDWAERNIITAPGGKISGVIDFELSTRSNIFSELAQCTLCWPQDVPHLLKGYNRQTGLAVQANTLFACSILRSTNFVLLEQVNQVWLNNQLHDDITEWARCHKNLPPRLRQILKTVFTPT